jgi:hypothetical protein
MSIPEKSQRPDDEPSVAQYFAEVERQINQRLRAEASSSEGRAALMRGTGIDDEQLVDELARLGITADGLIALRLFPLVLVAWAEASADHNEQTIAQGEARKLGIDERSVAWLLLDEWLTKLPRGISIDAWKRYMHATFKSMSKVAQSKLIDLTEKQMTDVAKASGGHMGIGKVSKKEQVMIDKLTSTMRKLMDGN